MILTLDTDVFVIALSCIHKIRCGIILLMLGKAYFFSKFKEMYDEAICDAILGLHIVTGCDTVLSSIRDKGKIKHLSYLCAHPEYIEAFAKLVANWDLQSSSFSKKLFCPQFL